MLVGRLGVFRSSRSKTASVPFGHTASYAYILPVAYWNTQTIVHIMYMCMLMCSSSSSSSNNTSTTNHNSIKSLSLYIYIYIYTYTHIHTPHRSSHHPRSRKRPTNRGKVKSKTPQGVFTYFFVCVFYRCSPVFVFSRCSPVSLFSRCLPDFFVFPVFTSFFVCVFYRCQHV